MNDDVYAVGGTSKAARLDDLEALVHERRGVDGDFLAHLPRRVFQGGIRRHPSELVP